MFQVNKDSHEKSSLIFPKDKSKKLKCHLLQFLFGALRVKYSDWLTCPTLKKLELALNNIFSYRGHS